MTNSHDPDPLAALTDVYTRCLLALEDGTERQWSPSVASSPRAEHDVSDPTGETAVDPRRLRLRLAVIETERSLEALREGASAAARHLEDALNAWAGKKH